MREGRPPVLSVRSTRDLGPQFVENRHRMVGQDGAYSIPLGQDEALWFFGDTLIGERPEGESLRSVFAPADGRDPGKGPFEDLITNTGLILRARHGGDGLYPFEYILDERGGLRKLVPAVDGEHPLNERIWCLHGCALGDRVYLYYMKIRMHDRTRGPDVPIGFDVLGSGLALGNRHSWQFERIRNQDGDTIWWRYPEPQFASTVIVDEDSDTVYCFGVSPDSEGVQQAYLNCVPCREIEDLTAYRYLSGPGPTWSSDLAERMPLFEGIPNEMSVSYNVHLDCYLAVHSYLLTGRIVARTAHSLWGPWSEPVEIFDVKAHSYAAKEHPELARDEGRVIYMTYIESNEYFPHLIEVTLG